MFIGHIATGFALKKIEPRVSLAWWIFSGLFLDVLWPIFLLLNIEKVNIVPGLTKVNPLDLAELSWSHSLLMVVIWSLALGFLFWLKFRDIKIFILMAVGVASHWVLDFLVHIPDLPLVPGGAEYGLGIWNNLTLTLILEFGLYIICFLLYYRSIKNKSKIWLLQLFIFLIFIAAFYLISVFGPPPPNDQNIIAISTLSLMVILVWVYFVDKKLFQ